ncbi:MAG: T9SS type A sorting domain-containing protein, partial [Bacteroidales bacterium]|nr:T9SS type A sorting domain-containing protein [Bacteroidales bacterium]
PFSAGIYIWLNTEIPSEITLTLCDASGKVIYSAEHKTENGEDYIRVFEGLSHLVHGIYIIRITSDNWQYSARLLKL